MKPSESKFVQRQMEIGKPFIIGTYLTCKVSTGERVNTESGKVEPYASIIHGLNINEEVVKISEPLHEQRLKDAIALPRDAEGKFVDRAAAWKFVGIKPADTVILLLKSYVWDQSVTNGKEKMQLRISGTVAPLL